MDGFFNTSKYFCVVKTMISVAFSDDMKVCKRNSCVHGYHIYKDVWDAVIGEELQCEREHDNGSDWYAVAIKKDGTIIGHLLCNIKADQFIAVPYS